MKFIVLFIALLLSGLTFSKDSEKVKTEGEITEIKFHQGRKVREIALVKFKLADGTEQIGSVELYRVPFMGSMKSVGDKIMIYYNKGNPAILETVMGSFLSAYGMYILIFLGIIMSIMPFLKWKKKMKPNS